MAGFKFKNYKPFECDITEYDSIIVKKVLINFGTVICTASNSLTNYFIPKIEGKEMIRSNKDNFLENNTLIVEETRGTISLKITLKNFDHQSTKGQWNKAFFNPTIAGFKNYIPKHVLPSMIEKRITTNFSAYDYSGLETGLTKKALVLLESATPADIAKEKEDLKKKNPNAIWTEANSAFYKLVDADENGIPLKGPPAYNARPLDICFDHNLFPLVNISNIISEVAINFISTTNTRIVEEKLDKYNFIQKEGDNYVKYIPIAWIDAGTVEQIVNFDYIYSFPHYFLIENLETFKTEK